jgi:imidazole glycerol-phosphate synthase subunit HisH
MKIAIVKYNAGNIQSVSFALNRLGIEPLITDDVKELTSADKVIFPGVGEASTAMNYLKERGLDQVIKNLKQPVLGICLGMQLMCRFSEENSTKCLGIFNQDVKLFPPTEKVPHMGWNTMEWKQNLLFKGLAQGAYVYFVHSYYAETGPDTICTSNYILPFSAGLHRDNFYGLQFHPEKSGEVGQKMLENFLGI